jgi:predicted amidophosphoribosyltransferase
VAKDKKKEKHEHEPPIKLGDKYICPHCKAEIPVRQDCPHCKLEIDWTKI